MSISRLGGLTLEPIPFLEEYISPSLPQSIRDIILERVQSIYAYRFFYQSNNNLVEGFLVEPNAGGASLPCIVYNRGGSNDFGSIAESFLFTSNIGRFASEGYLVIASQYSGCGKSEGIDDFCGEQTMNDIYRLYDLLKEDARADVSRIGMYGGSRGGMATYRCLRSVSWIKAAVTVAGSANLMDTDFRPEMEGHYQLMFGGSMIERQKRSVLEWVDELPKDVPMLVMHGTADWRVDPMDSLELGRRCIKANVPCRLIMYEGADHSLTEVWREAYHESLQWFHRFVRDGAPLPDLEPHGN